MIMAIHDPRRLIPYHPCEPIQRRPGALRRAIPVLEVPAELRLPGGAPVGRLGDYIIYNGHHRRLAAILGGLSRVVIAVLETDGDLFVNGGTELLRVSGGSIRLADHRRMIFGRVRSESREILRAEAALLGGAPAEASAGLG